MIYFYIILTYLLGSISAGYLLFKWKEKKDIRRYGSHNIGATNILRVSGWKAALPVALFDIFKGVFPVLLALKIFPDSRVAYAVGLSAVLGHCFPIFLKFKGGKGVATTIGVYAVLAVKPLLCIIALFILVIALTRYVSLGSLTAALSFPFFTLIFNGGNLIFFLGSAIFLLIAFRHKANIRRLIAGTERRLGEKTE